MQSLRCLLLSAALAPALAQSGGVAQINIAWDDIIRPLKTVTGFSKHDAVKGAASFTVEGDFSTKELAAALHKAGLHGEIK